MTSIIAPEPAPSPFLPGTNIQFAWDSTSIGLIKTCPRLYYYTMIEGWVPKDESVHLTFGREYHQALQDYDMCRASGLDHTESMFQSVRELLFRTEGFRPDPDTKAGKYKSREALVRTVIWYLDSVRQNDNFRTHILANGKPAVELSFRFELPFGPNSDQPYLLCGHLDRVCTDGNDLYIEDHKTTTSSLGDYFFNQFEPHNQMSLYTFGGQIVLETTVRGVIINGVQLLVDSSRFVRGFTFRTPDQIEEWVTDLSRWLDLAEWFASNSTWPQNDTACDKFGGCRFRNVCSKSPGVRDIYLKSNFTKVPEDEKWNPLKPR